MMNIDDAMLMAYVDGDLSAGRRAQVESAVAHSAELAGRLAAMRISVLPYGAAFERQRLSPLPDKLFKRIDELTRVSVGSVPQIRQRTALRRLAAAFLAGLLVTIFAWRLFTVPSPGLLASSVSTWVEAVVGYQALYTRETLTNINADPVLSAKVIQGAQQVDHLNVSVPDLRNQGLTFKRVQRLSFHDRPVIQIVYLPEGGGPVALCVTREAGPDEAPHWRELRGTRTVEWRRNQVGYILLARDPQADLIELGRRIANGATSKLYG